MTGLRRDLSSGKMRQRVGFSPKSCKHHSIFDDTEHHPKLTHQVRRRETRSDADWCRPQKLHPLFIPCCETLPSGVRNGYIAVMSSLKRGSTRLHAKCRAVPSSWPGGYRTRGRLCEIPGDQPPVPGNARGRELGSPEAAGPLRRAAAEAAAGVEPDALSAGSACPVLRLARSAHNRPTGDAPPLGPPGVPPPLALAAPRRTATPPGRSAAPDYGNGAQQSNVGRRTDRRGTPPEARPACLTAHRPSLHGPWDRRERITSALEPY